MTTKKSRHAQVQIYSADWLHRKHGFSHLHTIRSARYIKLVTSITIHNDGNSIRVNWLYDDSDINGFYFLLTTSCDTQTREILEDFFNIGVDEDAQKFYYIKPT